MTIFIDNRQACGRLRRRVFRQLANRLMQASAGRHAPPWESLTIIVTDDPEIRTAKQRCFGVDSVTDVIALPYLSMPGESRGPAAEIIVNVQEAVRRAGPAWPDISLELAFYLAHGCDHLAGHTDNTAPARRRMHARERRWLQTPAVRRLATRVLCSPRPNRPGKPRP